ncbi:hypothetical protein KO528_02610 [Saccharophagus degradans]|uniref:hypothetical protein n=1 Tax=Saccharophagus degradans TaxID=86304 RepID=UPI001C080747|nr:hypothetical protein [Saccharophagus degradans]MBU2984230.1 hypothetical protein [Saccharophagus degradans]
MHKDMRVIKTFKPKDNGAKRFANEWGDQLVAVRYREHKGRILTTIELVVDERRSEARASAQGSWLSLRKQTVVALKVAPSERELRKKIIKHNGAWSNQLKLWLCRYDRVTLLGLRNRVVEGAAERCRDVDLSFVAL